MIEWNKITIQEISARITSGGTPSTRKDEYYGGKIPWLKTKEINFNRLYKTESTITEEGLKNSSAKWIDENSIIVAMYGATAGRVAINKIPLTTNQACCNITIDPHKADYNFVYYNISNRYQELVNMSTGAAQQNLNSKMLRELEISVPDLPTQHQIAAILSSLDDKIELNLQMNQTLENMAQAIFKEWFVDFNFPGFEGELVDGLPKGWREVKLGSLSSKISKGTTPRKKDVDNLDLTIPFLKVRDLSDNGVIDIANLQLIPSEIHQCKLNRSILQTDDLLFSIAGTIGRVAILPEKLNGSNCNQAIAFIRLSDKQSWRDYIYYFLRSKNIQESIKSNIVQGVQANVSLTVLKNIDVVAPKNEIFNEWRKITKPILNKIKTNERQIRSLSKTRDALLPQLMSGQIEIA